MKTFCPECGFDVDIYEDGCCRHCGSTATGPAVDEFYRCLKDLVEVADAALGYIDALPEGIIPRFPAMPGFDREWAEEAISNARKGVKNES